MAQEVYPQGASGQKYAFTLYSATQNFNPVPAVYLLCRLHRGGPLEVLYVGETQSLKQRLIPAHDGYMRAIKADMTHIAAMSVVNHKDRLRIETDLRHGLNPSCNAQGLGAARS